MPVSQLLSNIRHKVARRRFSRIVRPFQEHVLGMPFSRAARLRIMAYYHKDAICWSQVYPFFRNADLLKNKYGADIRARPVTEFLTGDKLHEADIVLVQPWLSEPAERVGQAFARYRERYPQARLIFLDPYAQCDLRYGRAVEPYIHRYQKKSLFRDKSLFLRAFRGDTNLTEYYSDLFGIEAQPTDWQVPENLLNRLSLVPNFLTADYLTEGFLGPEPEFNDRPIDLHSRLATKGTAWYSAMRKSADEKARDLRGITITPIDRIPRDKFLEEMRQSRLCWSPFGYGELCWRDLEAFMTGAVLVKPDMSHLETLPDLYVANETYLPVRWDYSDLEQVIRQALANPDNLRRIALNAFEVAKGYLSDDTFLTDTSRDLGL
ncbi:MAG: glycosyltransferase family 1 protein [Paracoccus sp. (in: a-proteobacteria)]|nr:glycosyltransferase family 1 protein [Paracoccus sp. (in: a-proteobacteria)]